MGLPSGRGVNKASTITGNRQELRLRPNTESGMRDFDADYDVVHPTLEAFSTFRFCPPQNQHTVLASFVLTRHFNDCRESKVISLATGTKCLPATRLPTGGEAVHDSHAEVLARRAAVRWIFEETARCDASLWICKTSSGKYTLKEGVELNMYISTLPCGDASMRHLASVQDPEMAAIKDSTIWPSSSAGSASRGRDNYHLFSVLRTKPGRADSPPTRCMSCSDKIAAWTYLGILGALASSVFEAPIYVSMIVIGVEGVILDLENLREDCERAFWRRLSGVQEVYGYTPHRPIISFSIVPFAYSNGALKGTGILNTTSCNESLCWIADRGSEEVLINGLKRGVSPKHRFRPKAWPLVSKVSLYQLYTSIVGDSGDLTYRQAKDNSSTYQAAKTTLIGPTGPFHCWVKSVVDGEHESFLATDPLS